MRITGTMRALDGTRGAVRVEDVYDTGIEDRGGPLVSDRIRLDGTTVNAPDALALAEFYAELTGGVARGTAHWAAVSGPNGFLAFQQADHFCAPTWPDGAVPAHLHLDFLVDDLEATGARASAAGATRLGVQPNSDHCVVYADPAGHPFCLSTWHGQDLFDGHADDRQG